MSDTTLTPSNPEWKNVERFPGYKVSRNGQVMGKNKNLLKSWDSHGYKIVQLYKDGIPKRMGVHRLVGEAFLEKPIGNGWQINHKNCITSDNRLDNLEWRDPKGNMKHYFEELKKYGIKQKKQRIGIYNVKTQEWHIFESIGEASRFFKVEDSTMCSNAIDYHNNGKLYRKEWLIYKLDDDYEVCKSAYPTKEHLTMGAVRPIITE